jgi:hypothetical protein
MNAKSVITLLLLIFVGGSVLYLAIKESAIPWDRSDSAELSESESATPSEESAAVSQVDEDSPREKVLVYYFHRTRRCQKCLAIERYAHEAIREGFPSEMDSGRIEWHPLNLDEAGNGHFVDDYDLSFSTVIVVEKKGEEQIRWQNLQDVWKLVQGEKSLFLSYVQEAVQEYLEG